MKLLSSSLKWSKLPPEETNVSYKSILVHIDYTERAYERMDVAIDLAQRFSAHLCALAPAGNPMLPYTGGADALGNYAAEVMAELARLSEVSVERFREKAKTAGFGTFDARACDGDAVYALRSEALYADLIVVGQTDKAIPTPARPNDLPESLVLGTGRPVLIVPFVGRFAHVGRRVLLLWNESRESARAARDALPLLRTAQQVDVIAFDSKRGSTGVIESGIGDIGNYLARHGVNVNVAREPSGKVEIGALALSRAADHGSDLIVMGGYGHTRLREWVLGGVSRSILEHMTVPVLMSH
jgi:nucleotide-binding universal stress UspA family protein